MIMPVERAIAAEHLELANRHVAEGQRRVEAQLTLIARLERDGHDSGPARELLRQFEKTLALQMETRDRIVEELRQGREHDFR